MNFSKVAKKSHERSRRILAAEVEDMADSDKAPDCRRVAAAAGMDSAGTEVPGLDTDCFLAAC